MADTGTSVQASPVGLDARGLSHVHLVLDVALGTPEGAILDAYNLQAHQFEFIRQQPLFIAEVARVKKELERDGMSFKMKARLQAEAMLERSWAMVHNPATPAAVAGDLIKATVRWAGYDMTAGGAGGNSSAQFSIQINLGSGLAAQPGVTIDQDAANGDS